MAETIKTKTHLQAAVNGGISFEDLKKAFEDACDRLEQQQTCTRELVKSLKKYGRCLKTPGSMCRSYHTLINRRPAPCSCGLKKAIAKAEEMLKP